MKKEIGCVIAAFAMEAIVGVAAGVMLNRFVLPKCTNAEKAIVTGGTAICGWALGRKLDRTFYKWCDEVLHTDLKEVIDVL